MQLIVLQGWVRILWLPSLGTGTLCTQVWPTYLIKAQRLANIFNSDPVILIFVCDGYGKVGEVFILTQESTAMTHSLLFILSSRVTWKSTIQLNSGLSACSQGLIPQSYMPTFTSWKVPACDSQFGRRAPEWTPAAHFLTGPVRRSLVTCPFMKIWLLLFGLAHAQQWDYWNLECVYLILECITEFLLGVYPALPTGLLLYVNFWM